MKKLGEIRISPQQGKALLTVKADLGLTVKVMRFLTLEVCKQMCIPFCQKLFWDEQAKETHSSGMQEWQMA